MNKPQRRLALAVLALLCSCMSYEVVRLPTFDAAAALAPSVPQPVFLDVSQVPQDMPMAAPFAHVSCGFAGNCSAFEQATLLNAECAERGLSPDFVVFHALGITSDGNHLQVSPTFSGGGFYGLTFSSAPSIYKRATAVCYRLAPVSLGLVADGNWMVTHVDEGAKPSGIQEGDSIQSIDGSDVRPRMPQDVAPWLAAALRHKPGNEVAVEWIRPGTGRMRGRLILQRPQPMPADAKPLPATSWWHNIDWPARQSR